MLKKVSAEERKNAELRKNTNAILNAEDKNLMPKNLIKLS